MVRDARLNPSVDFVRVLGNTTGSHVAGSKANPYGALEIVRVPSTSFGTILREQELIKMDVEGLEADLIDAIPLKPSLKLPDIILEVGTAENSRRIFDSCRSRGLNMFPQRTNWRKATVLADLPTSYRDGSLFISLSDEMNWGQLQH